MSKLEELIEQYCPDGVEYYKIKDVYKRIKGTPITAGKMKEIATPDGSVRIFAGGKTVIDANEKDIPNANITRVPAVLIQSRGVIDAVYYDKPFTFKNEMWAYTTFNQKSVKYLYYILKSNIQTFRDAASGMGALPQISLGVTEEFEIPVPPLPVQEEIVRILDAFTELQAELQAELQKRLQQYEYYKWNIFEGLSCPTKHITDVALVKARVGWQRLTTAEYQETGDYYLITGTDFKNGKIDFNSCVFVSKERYEMDPNIIVGKGDILITKDGTLGKVAFMAEEPNKPTTLNSGVFRIHTTDLQVSSRYLFHYFTSKYFTDFVNSVKTGSTIPHLTQQGLVSLNIPIPSLEEQNRVVSILDRFDTLTTDLTQGLPAEIEKRRQQYEYYRDKLLTFRRKGA